LVIDPNAELAFAVADKRFEPITAKRPQVFQRSRRVQPDLARSSLLFDVYQFNDAQDVY
jgi:hypothetical protein